MGLGSILYIVGGWGLSVRWYQREPASFDTVQPKFISDMMAKRRRIPLWVYLVLFIGGVTIFFASPRILGF
jgi:uncharacterized membrane protein